jgi:type II secretory pathway pseudopilin PulG
MKSFKRFSNWIRNSKGVATSLVEATATVAVGAVLAGVAVSGALDAINNSKVQAAINDVQAIGNAVITFYKDNSFVPLFGDGNKTGVGPTDSFYGFLVSENGSFPTDTSNASPGWIITENADPWTTSGFFGTKPDYKANTDGSGSDSIEGHLMKNVLGNASFTTCTATSGNLPCYPLRGQYVGDPNRGWAGPYVTTLPKTDPWGDKYIINIRNLHAPYLTTVASTYAACTSGSALPNLAVFVMSAGPNRTIETPVNQCSSDYKALGDDVTAKIK